MGGDAFTKIENTGGEVGLRKNSWTSDCVRVSPSSPWGRLRRKPPLSSWRCMCGLSTEAGISESSEGGWNKSHGSPEFPLPEMGREWNRAKQSRSIYDLFLISFLR